jgi:DNA-binding MarR family transcriptional regulator
MNVSRPRAPPVGSYARSTAVMSASAERVNARAAYFVGDEGLRAWTPEQIAAWTGVMEGQRRLARDVESELEAKHGLALSALGLIGRLAAAEDGILRLSTLAGEMGLSLSRVSRIVDALEARGLVERRPCPSDARATNAWLTPAGLALAREAQATVFASIQARFFDQLAEDEVEVLASVFTRFLGAGDEPGAACDQPPEPCG